MRFEAKHPEFAPHCPSCGYNLHGLPHLNCPECGRRIETPAQLELARWLAERNAPDRRARLAEILAGIVGTVLFACGIAFNILHLIRQQFFGGLLWTEVIGAGLFFTWVILYPRKKLDYSLLVPMLFVGGLWFVGGFCVWYAG